MSLYPVPKPQKPILLKGKAYTAFRLEVFEHFKGFCQDCGHWFPLNGNSVFIHGHVSHIIRRAKGGDILANVKWKCYNCHINKEHGPQWSKKNEEN